MKIGIAGPMSLRLLESDIRNRPELPVGYPAPIISMLINGLMERGHKVVAFTTSVGIHEPVVLKDVRLTICIAPREPHAARDLFKSERQGLLRLMQAFPVDLINAHWSYEFAWAALDTGMPVLVTLHDHALTILRYQLDAYRLMRWMMNGIVLNRARYLSANSQYMYDLLNRRDKRKTRITPNYFCQSIEAYVVEKRNPQNFILSISNGFGNRKNIATALHAFALVRKSFPEMEYRLVGDGMEEGGPVQMYALKNHLTEGVHFCGSLSYPDTLAMLQSASVFLHPSREESFGMTVLEAMVIGVPAVGGEQSGNIPFLLDHGKAGFLCDVNSSQSIADTLITVLSEPQNSQNVCDYAQGFARQNYSEKVVNDKFLDYYHQIIVTGNEFD
ncbi:MAG: glycosyltransferase [Anaerolineaceae bacterium]|nr:glycosyltransferase [Anaerolineaceae bacterium]